MTFVVTSPKSSSERRASKDLPHLSLSVDSAPSHSPFPSPSSTFVPPPMQNAHEFAISLPLSPKPTAKRESENLLGKAGSSANGHARTESAGSVAAPTPTTPKPASDGSGLAAPAQDSPPTTPTTKRSSLAAPVDEFGLTQQVHSRHGSLNSRRPAPPSPSISRRASAAPSSSSHHSAASASNNTSRCASNRRSSQSAKPKRTSLVIRIRDFAFPSHDVRHTGNGPDAPRASRARSRFSTASSASEAESEGQHASGWGPFKWAGSKVWGFGLGASGSGSRAQADEDRIVPTRSDFERNFDISSPADEYLDDEDGDEGYAYAEEQSGYPDQDIPLLPGLYRALYAFEPEGTAEMALVEDQVVRIIGRGGGVGWAIAEREGGGHALVPESYLEPVKLNNLAGAEGGSRPGGGD